MPRSYQAYPQNAVVTHSPANVVGGDPSKAIQDGKNVFKVPSFLDACAGVTNGTRNPFISGLNTMGEGNNTSGVNGQTGNIMSGFQQFTDSLCGFALGGNTVSEVLTAARKLRDEGGDLHGALEAIRSSDLYQRLRGTVGTGTSPQSVLAGVEAVTNLTNGNQVVQGAIATGQAAAGISGNQVVDAINGGQVMTGQGHQLLTGTNDPNASGSDLLTAGGQAIQQNTSNHVGNQSVSTAQSVTAANQNLLVSQDFAHSYTVAADPTGHWAWDGTMGDPSTNVLGCLKCTVNGTQPDYLSSEIPVVAGENIELAATLRWDGLTYSGASPLVLGVEKYRQMRTPSGAITYADIGGFDVASVHSPGGTSSGAWVGIAGIYTVQPGVDQIRMRFRVAHNATTGVVRWDNGELLKIDLIGSECVPATGQTVDNIVTNLYGTAGTGFTQNQAAVALANTATGLSSVTARVAALEAEGSTGAIAGDDFNYTGELIASGNWGGRYSSSFGGTDNITGKGYYQANGADAVWVEQGNPTGLVYSLFDWLGTDSVSQTDYQLVQVVLDSAPAYDAWTGAQGSVFVIGRMSADYQNYVGVVIGGNGDYQVFCFVAGTYTTLDSGKCTVPGRGSIISLYCGDKATSAPRLFKVQVGTQVISNFVDTGNVSVYGASYRKWGWAGGTGSIGNKQWMDPPQIAQWLGQDQ